MNLCTEITLEELEEIKLSNELVNKLKNTEYKEFGVFLYEELSSTHIVPKICYLCNTKDNLEPIYGHSAYICKNCLEELIEQKEFKEDKTSLSKELKAEFEESHLIFSKTLKAKRKDMGIGINQLAEYLGLSPSYVGLIERGEKFPSLKTLLMLCYLYETTPNDLFGF